MCTVSVQTVPGSVFYSGDTIELVCAVTGADGQPVVAAPDSLVWTCDSSVSLGTGARVTAACSLAPGPHRITVTVRNDGAWCGAASLIEVVPWESARVVLGGSKRGCSGMCGVYWIGDSLHVVPEAYIPGPGSHLAVRTSGSDICLFGPRDNVVRYWRNGSEVSLSSSPGAVSDLRICEGVVHVVGYEETPGRWRQFYHEGATDVPLRDSLFVPMALWCDGDSVVIAGRYGLGSHTVATWSEGRLDTIALPDSVGLASVLAVDASHSGVRMVLSGSVSVGDVQTLSGWYLHDGVLDPIRADPAETDPQRYLRVVAACFSGGDIYATGSIPRYPPVGYIWKNGVATKVATAIDDTTGWEYSTEAMLDITVHNGQVFMVGSYLAGNGANGTYHPCYWRDGRRYDLAGVSDSVQFHAIGVAGP